MATAARRASSSASARSAGVYDRPLSACTSVSAPSTRPRAVRGTQMYERSPRARIIRRCSGSRAAAVSISSGMSGHHLRLARPQHVVHALRRGAVGGPALLDLAGQAHLVGVNVLHRQPLQLAVVRQHVHGAPVRQPGDRQPRDGAQRGPRVQRRRQHAAGLGQEVARLLRLPALGDVGDGAHPLAHAAAGPHHRHRAHGHVPPRAVRAAQAQLHLHHPPLGHRLPPLRRHARAVVRVHGGGPSPAAGLLPAGAGVRGPAALRLHELAVGAGRPHHLRGRDDQRAEARPRCAAPPPSPRPGRAGAGPRAWSSAPRRGRPASRR